MRGILTLHSIDESGSVLSMRPSELDSLLDAIQGSGHTIVPLSELLGRPGVPDRIAITFDDALGSVAEEGLPLLARRGLVATVFVVSSRVGTDNGWRSQPAWVPRLSSMGWGELEALAEAGWEIGSHTNTHPRLTDCNDSIVRDELRLAHEQIEGRLGVSPEVFAYPYGAVDERILRLVGETYRFGLGGRLSALDAATDHPLDLPRLDGYYLRDTRVHRWFGGPLFSGWIDLRRRAREHRQARP